LVSIFQQPQQYKQEKIPKAIAQAKKPVDHYETFAKHGKNFIPPHLNPLPCGYSSNGGEEAFI